MSLAGVTRYFPPEPNHQRIQRGDGGLGIDRQTLPYPPDRAGTDTRDLGDLAHAGVGTRKVPGGAKHGKGHLRIRTCWAPTTGRLDAECRDANLREPLNPQTCRARCYADAAGDGVRRQPGGMEEHDAAALYKARRAGTAAHPRQELGSFLLRETSSVSDKRWRARYAHGDVITSQGKEPEANLPLGSSVCADQIHEADPHASANAVETARHTDLESRRGDDVGVGLGINQWHPLLEHFFGW